MKSISRRDFLKVFGAGAAGVIVNPKFKLPGERLLHSTVVQCYDTQATSGSTINAAVVQVMMDESIKALTGVADVGEAWKSIFPGITSTSVISIKVNCFTELPTHPEFAYAIAGGLQKMMFGGNYYDPYNIIIWDWTDAYLTGNGGYTINYNTPGLVRCFGTTHSGVGFDTSTLNVNGTNVYPSRILSQMSNYVIDAGVMKTHSMATVTLTLKNHYGSVNNPGWIHGNGSCNPEIPSLNQQIRDALNPQGRQKIFLIDGLFGLYSGGPGGSPNCNPKKIIMSLDTVATDAQGQIAINVERVAHGLSQVSAPHIITASQAPYNLGTTDINLIEINNPYAVKERNGRSAPESILRITPNPVRNRFQVRITMDNDGYAYLTLVNAAGRLQTNIFAGWLTRGTHTIRHALERKLPAGSYIVRFQSPSRTWSKKLTVIP